MSTIRESLVYSASTRTSSHGRVRGSLAILGFDSFSLIVLSFSTVFPLVFDPGDLIFLFVSRFSDPWRPYDPTLWLDFYCIQHFSFLSLTFLHVSYISHHFLYTIVYFSDASRYFSYIFIYVLIVLY